MDTDPIELRTESRPVAIYLSHDEALVLDAFLARGMKADDDYSRIEDQAELKVLWGIGGILKSWLVAPLLPDYDDRLAAARAAIRDKDE